MALQIRGYFFYGMNDFKWLSTFTNLNLPSRDKIMTV